LGLGGRWKKQTESKQVMINKIHIDSRSAVLGPNSLHPFQAKTLEVIRDTKVRLLIVEAPVGAGKSRIVRKIALDPDRKDPIILTYPTKILMETQLATLKKEVTTLSVWPDDQLQAGGVQAFNYSTDALVRFMRRQNMTVPPDRSVLWQKVLFTQEGMGGALLLVTTPDVLWLLFIGEVYRPANRFQNYLQNAIVVFDEFHLYYNLETFPELVKKLLETVAQKVILLSATPIVSDTLYRLQQQFSTKVVKFEEGGNGNRRVFNYPLEVYIHTFPHTKIEKAEEKIRSVLQGLPTPAAIIMDSVFRLAHLRRRLLSNLPQDRCISEWSGRLKEMHGALKEGDIIMGTSSIEVGIDMVFHGAIIEAWEWPSTIQRLGRVGRHASGEVHLFSRSRDLAIAVGNRTKWGRTEFEQEVLRVGLVDPRVEKIYSGGFRGQSFPFLMYDLDLQEAILYDEHILCQYEVSNIEEYWQEYSLHEKREYLKKQLGLMDDRVEELLLYDALIPWWGVLQGTLNDRYNRIEYLRFDSHEKELTIQTSSDSFAFYGRQDG